MIHASSKFLLALVQQVPLKVDGGGNIHSNLLVPKHLSKEEEQAPFKKRLYFAIVSHVFPFRLLPPNFFGHPLLESFHTILHWLNFWRLDAFCRCCFSPA